jgi:thymidylate synthase (FAD)
MKKEPISCEYIMHMGDDLNVVNNARVSFDKESDSLTEQDKSLIRFLATGFRKSEWNEMIQSVRSMTDLEIHKLFLKLRRHAAHWAPMAHPHVQMRIVAPIFLARQYVKHQIGLTWSEVSRRYTDGEPSFWFPEGWRARPEGGVKQGSSDECVDKIKSHCPDEWSVFCRTEDAAEEVVNKSLNLYLDMIESQVAPELARIILPQNMMVTWRWTGSLAAFARVGQQRLDSHAQKEAQILGREIGNIMASLFPVTWDAMVGDCEGHLNSAALD